MKPVRNLQPVESTPYSAEKDLRGFAELTSEGLATLLTALTVEIDEALRSSDLSMKDAALTLTLKSLEQALFISKNLRYFSKKSRVSHKLLDVSQQILNTLDSLEVDLKKQAIDLGAFIESGIVSRLDAGALDQIISNLLLHAMSAMPRGGKLTVALARAGETLEFCISDTGRGMTSEQLEHLFEPYFAVHHESFHSKDRGLGLIVAKALIDSEGGRLTVKSTPGKGTNFIFTLPYDTKGEKPEPYTQKRRYPRIKLTLPAEVRITDAKPFLTRITTVSTGGCFLELPSNVQAPNKNTLISLTLFSLGDSPLRIERARVAHCASTGTGTGIGVEFPKLDKKTHDVLAAIVKGHS